MRWWFLVCLSVFASCATRSDELKAFRSDGCSAFPEGTLRDPQRWHAHCVKHDLAYWGGGTREQRLEADRELMRNVQAEGHPVLARWMYLGVRVGGAPWWPTPWRWGFGWAYPRGYEELSLDEQRQVDLHKAALTEAP